MPLGNMTSKELKPAPRWQEYTVAAATAGTILIVAGANNVVTAYGTGPAAVMCGKGGFLSAKDHDGEERGFHMIAGALYPCAGITSFTGSTTVCDEILFLYNHPETE